MVDQVANFKKVTVSTGYNNTATSIVLTTGQGAELPDPSGDNYNVVWWDSTNYNDPADDPNVEIVRVTAKSTDTLTVTRNQESSGASNKNNADATYKMILPTTAKTITDITDILTDAVLNSDIKDQSFTNLLDNGNFESWSAGTSSAPDEWTVANGATIIQESTIIKIDTYSSKVTSTAASSLLRHRMTNEEELRYASRTLTLSCWVYSSIASMTRLAISESGGTTYSSYHTGGSSWELLTVSRTISAAPTYLDAAFYPDALNGTSFAYFDGAILVEGSVCPAFSPKPLSANDLTIHMQTPQTLTGAGAVDIVTDITHIVTTAADALTLVDGTEGQEKFIVMKTDDGDGTLTPSNLGNGTTITFDDVGDSAHLLFTNGAWHFIGGTATLA